jgi:hypothetical protein
MTNTDNLNKLRRRLKKIGIEIELTANLPWIYLYSVNGKWVEKEEWTAEHGFTIAYYNWSVELTDLSEIFRIIRKYK